LTINVDYGAMLKVVDSTPQRWGYTLHELTHVGSERDLSHVGFNTCVS